MAVTCANPNTAEFKALMGKYKNDTLVQLVINDWQSLAIQMKFHNKGGKCYN